MSSSAGVSESRIQATNKSSSSQLPRSRSVTSDKKNAAADKLSSVLDNTEVYSYLYNLSSVNRVNRSVRVDSYTY